MTFPDSLCFHRNIAVAEGAFGEAALLVHPNTWRLVSPFIPLRSHPSRRAMRSDSLPSPLNVPQELLGAVFWRHRERAKEVFARGVFWMLSGSLAVVGTAMLWTVSLPRTLAWAIRASRSGGTSMFVPALLGISFSLGLAPAITGWLWIQGISGVWYQGHGAIEVGRAYTMWWKYFSIILMMETFVFFRHRCLYVWKERRGCHYHPSKQHRCI